MDENYPSHQRSLIKSIAVYLGSAWVFIEALNFLIDKYYWDTKAMDILILLVVFGLPAVIIDRVWDGKLTKYSILFHLVNILVALAVILYSTSSESILNPRQLRLLHIKSNKQKIAESIRTIAVLPFKQYVGDSTQEILISGMHGALINQLGKSSAINVIAKVSVDNFKNQKLSAFASELGADGIVEIAVLSIGNNYEFDVSLISPNKEGTIIWSDNLAFPKEDIQLLFRKIIGEVAKRIDVAITSGTDKNKADLVDPTVYEAFIKGKYLSENIPSEKNLELSLQYFNRAIQLDSTFAPAYAGISWVWISKWQAGFASGPESMSKIYNNNRKALELDPDYYESYYHKAIMSFQNWDWESSEKAFRKAIELYPNHAFAHAHYAHLLMILKRPEEALVHIEQAMKLDPLNEHVLGLCALAYMFKGDQEKAIAAARKFPNTFGRQAIESWEAYIKGDFKKLLSFQMQGLNLDTVSMQLIYEDFDLNGYHSAVKLLANHFKQSNPNTRLVGLSVIYSMAGMWNDAIESLEAAYENHDPNIPYLFLLPQLDSIKDDGRVIELARKLSLPLN